jgi:chromosome transmission fidelity protein 1
MAATQDSLILPTPDSFPTFPFETPYSIQVDLMRHLYSAIERRQTAIAESPTGTVSSQSPLRLGMWLTPVFRGKL